MMISRGCLSDIAGLARLLWLMADDEERTHATDVEFRNDLSRWWAERQDSHVAFVARVDAGDDDADIVGMAWVALVSRVPRPGSMERRSADIQSVFVKPQHRGHGIGSALVAAALEHARQSGAVRVTVHSGSTAIPMYERLGFEPSRHLLQRTID